MTNDAMSGEDPFEKAVSLHQSGRFAEAIVLYEAVLQAEGEDASLLELLGAALAGANDDRSALVHLDRSIDLDPRSSTARHQRGMIRERMGLLKEAVEDYRVALDCDAGSSKIAERLGLILMAMGEANEACEVFSIGLSHDRHSASLLRQRAEAEILLSRFSEAERDLCALLAVQPEDPTGLTLLTRCLARQGRTSDWIVAARRSFQAQSRSAEARLMLAMALANSGDAANAEEAISILTVPEAEGLPWRPRERILAVSELAVGRVEQATIRVEKWLAQTPEDPLALGILASLQRSTGRLADALQSIRRAVEAAPDDPTLLLELGRIHLERGDADSAIKVFEEEIRLGRAVLVTWFGLIDALKRRGLLVKAVQTAEQALSSHGDDFELRTTRGMLLHDMARHVEAVSETRRAALATGSSQGAISCHLLGLHYPAGFDEQSVVEEHRALAMRIHGSGARSETTRNQERSLRVGLVSADLKTHSVAWFIRPLLRSLQLDRLEAFAYSNTVAIDSMTESLRATNLVWREVRGRSDELVDRMIRDDGIDVLIDLGGHTADNRLGVFRRSPAPVQMTWLGYPNTTGVPEIGWRIVDGLTDPSGVDAYATEALLRMAAPFLCFDADMTALDMPDRPERPVVFGSFNNTAKLSDRCLELWGRVIEAVPGSTLLLKSRAFEDSEFRGPTLDRLERFGIDRSRVELVGFSHGLGAHHLAYAKIDIALDTFPYHGTTTTCEALWNGVPVVSRIGDVHRARVGMTLLHAVGLPELACEDDDSFVQAAERLASDVAWRRSLHADLRDRMRRSPLCDGPGFARRFEAAIRHAWRCWCRGEAPRGAFLPSQS